MPIVIISNQEALQTTLAEAGGKLMILEFSTAWAFTCQHMEPFVNRLCDDYDTLAIFAKVDTQVCPQLVKNYKVTTAPTFVFLNKGNEVDRICGPFEKTLKYKIEKLIGRPFTIHGKKQTVAVFKVSREKLDVFGRSRTFPGQGLPLGDVADIPPETDNSKDDDDGGGWVSKTLSLFGGSKRSKVESKQEDPQTKMNVNMSLPTARVHIRLTDNSKLILTLNLNQPVSKIREFILLSRPDYRTYEFTLKNSVTFPLISEITNESVSIEDAKLANAVVYQEIKK